MGCERGCAFRLTGQQDMAFMVQKVNATFSVEHLAKIRIEKDVFVMFEEVPVTLERVRLGFREMTDAILRLIQEAERLRQALSEARKYREAAGHGV